VLFFFFFAAKGRKLMIASVFVEASIVNLPVVCSAVIVSRESSARTLFLCVVGEIFSVSEKAKIRYEITVENSSLRYS